MKSLLFSLAVALAGAATLALFSPNTAAASGAEAESVRLRVEVDRGVLPAETTEKAVIKIALDGIRPPRRELRPPVNLALVIDRSGSMGGDKIEKAREAALEAVRRLAPDDIVSLIAYDTNAQTLIPAQRVGNGRQLERAIRGLEVGGNTALHAGVTRGAAEVRRHIEDRRYARRMSLAGSALRW
jgi:Ca-activated chloride channel homolog